MPNPVTVLTVDDQAVFLRAAAKLIAACPGFELIGEATSGPEALELAAALRPDLVLLDVRMPGMDGVETAVRLTASDPQVAIVLISLEEIPELPASLDGTKLATLRKQQLSSRTLSRVWAGHRLQHAR